MILKWMIRLWKPFLKAARNLGMYLFVPDSLWIPPVLCRVLNLQGCYRSLTDLSMESISWLSHLKELDISYLHLVSDCWKPFPHAHDVSAHRSTILGCSRWPTSKASRNSLLAAVVASQMKVDKFLIVNCISGEYMAHFPLLLMMHSCIDIEVYWVALLNCSCGLESEWWLVCRRFDPVLLPLCL
jgi:hypothetical protein